MDAIDSRTLDWGDDETFAKSLTIRCICCGAKPGKHCIGTAGPFFGTWTHIDRREPFVGTPADPPPNEEASRVAPR